jgi:hypothetical protein
LDSEREKQIERESDRKPIIQRTSDWGGGSIIIQTPQPNHAQHSSNLSLPTAQQVHTNATQLQRNATTTTMMATRRRKHKQKQTGKIRKKTQFIRIPIHQSYSATSYSPEGRIGQ